MLEPISLTIFFPAYNEEDNIQSATEEAVRVAESSPYIGEYEILIINDGSSDRTKEIAESLALRYRAVRVINHAHNRGYGAALKTGVLSAQMDYVFFTDADLQFDIAELQNLLIHAPRFDAVIGYRAPRRDPAMRLMNAWGWNKLNRLLFGLTVRDIDCAFKLFRRDQIQAITLHSYGAMVSAEMLIKLTRNGARIKEVPVSHMPRVAGSPTGAKPSVILRAFREMARLYSGELGSAAHKQAFKFMAVGVINTLLDAVAYIVLTRATPIFSEHLVAAKFFSFLAGTVTSLTLNRWWTFGVRQRLTLPEVARFYAAVSLSIIVNVEGMNLLVSAGMYDLLALAITTIGTFAIGFTLSKFWVFRSQPRAKALQPSPIK